LSLQDFQTLRCSGGQGESDLCLRSSLEPFRGTARGYWLIGLSRQGLHF